MKQFLVIVLVLAVAGGALGYWRGWFTVGGGGNARLEFDPAKFKADRAAFGKSVGERATAARDRVASLWTKSEKLTADEKAGVRAELAELKVKHDRIEQQIKDLDEAGDDKFEGIKQDLSASLEDVEKKSEALMNKLEKAKDK